MPQVIIHLDEKNDRKVKDYMIEWSLSKHDAIVKMIELFKEEIQRR